MDARERRPGRVEVTLLGALQVCGDGRPVPLAGARLRGLAVRLALGAGEAVGNATLVDALWNENRPADPANALQSLVSRLRRTLGSATTVEQVVGGYRLNVTADDVDAARFERLAAEGRRRLHAGDAAPAAAVLRPALDLWSGPVAVEVAHVAPAIAARLARAGVEAAADLAEAELSLGRHVAVAGRLADLLREHPLHERLAGLLMDALTAQGRQAEALAVYERIRGELAEALGADPGTGLRECHLRALRLDSRSSGPDGGRPPGATNLPAPLTSFIGRDEELARVDALLDTGRLVTVLGPGGAGKTRLALEAAGRRHDRFRDGIRLIDLAAVTEPAEVAGAIGSALGVRGAALFEQRPGRGAADCRGLVELLIERLATADMLLLVDNCEHLIEAAAALTTTLLVRCPRLRVLATSREPLAVDGEALVPLAPLELPPADADPATAARAPAVRLFVERTAAVRPGFTVDATTVRDVVQVVRSLDGLPLALELAAARLRNLPLPALAAGLSDRFRLLTGGSRTALPRHRTLRAVIAWSWDLLSADERTVADRISVLPAGATPRSATVLCAGGGIPAERVPELLAALVDRSMLQLVDAGPRYRMLETLREYGIERLVARGELTAVRDTASRYAADLVAQIDPLLRTAEQLPAIRLLRAEYDNAVAALRHLCDTGDGRAAVSLALDLSWFWSMHGHRNEAVFWLREALAAPGDSDPLTRDYAYAVQYLHTMGVDAEILNESGDDRRTRLRELSDRLLSHDELPGFFGVLSSILLFLAGDEQAAGERIDRAVAGGDVWLSGMAQVFRARIAENAGDMAQVRGDAAGAMAAFREVGDRWGQAAALPLRAITRIFDGDLDGAEADLHAARALSREFGSLDVDDEVFLDLRLADLHMRRGERAKAEAALTRAHAHAARSSTHRMAVLIDALEAGLLASLGELDRAESLLRQVDHQLADDFGPVFGDHGTAIVGTVKALIALARDDPASAERSLVQAYAAALSTQDMPVLAMVAVGAAALSDARGAHRDTAVLLGAAARLRGAEDPTEIQVARLTRRSRATLGDAAFTQAYAAGRSLNVPAARNRVDPAHRHSPTLTATPAHEPAAGGTPQHTRLAPAAGDGPDQARRA